MQVHVVKHGRVGTGVGKAHAGEADAVIGLRPALDLAAEFLDRRFQVLVERRQVQVVLVQTADRGEACRNRRLALAKEHDVHRHLAERDACSDRRERDPGVSAIERRSRDQAEQEAPCVAADGEVTVLPVEPVEYCAITIEEERSKAEQLDLLGVILPREHGFEVELHPRFRRAPEKEAKRHAGKPGLGHEGGQPGCDQDGDGPRRELGEEGAVAYEGDCVLHEAEGPHYER